jgi:myo-inositol-1-phosphate synthase
MGAHPAGGHDLRRRALNLELKLEVWDSPNSAGVVIDAVRCAKLALDRKLAGPLLAPSSYFMKSPPRQYTDDEARIRTERFIAGLDEDGDDEDGLRIRARLAS